MPTNLEMLTNNYGVTDGTNVWSNNLLAPDTVAQADGGFARKSAVKRAAAAELPTLRELAAEAMKVAGRLEVGMGSESGTTFEPFACHLGSALGTIDDPTIRSVFGDALYPGAKITLEPLSESTAWWRSVLVDSGLDEDDGEEADPETVEHWRRVVAWFQAPGRFAETRFVAVGERPPAHSFDAAGGCVFVRLLLGLHSNGGLSGLFGIVVHT